MSSSDNWAVFLGLGATLSLPHLMFSGFTIVSSGPSQSSILKIIITIIITEEYCPSMLTTTTKTMEEWKQVFADYAAEANVRPLVIQALPLSTCFQIPPVSS